MNYINIEKNEQIQNLSNLAYEIWHEYWPVILKPEQIDYMTEKFQSFDAIKKQLQNENYTYMIIEDNNMIIGYFGISVRKDYLFLSKLYIKKEFRFLGYGTKIFEKIKELAKKNNKKSIQLTVNKYNTNTIKAYKKWGFKEIDSVVTDIGNGFVMDDYIMEYKL